MCMGLSKASLRIHERRVEGHFPCPLWSWLLLSLSLFFALSTRCGRRNNLTALHPTEPRLRETARSRPATAVLDVLTSPHPRVPQYKICRTSAGDLSTVADEPSGAIPVPRREHQPMPSDRNPRQISRQRPHFFRISDSVAGAIVMLLLPLAVAAQGTAAFDASPSQGCTTPHTVFFTDQSSAVPVAWNWDFGDSGTSTAQNPIHSYTSTGSFLVQLMVTFDDTSQDMATANISVGLQPTADFSASPTTFAGSPASVDFTDLSTNAVEWLWDFGDGNTSTQQNPTHQYQTNDEFDVTLTVTNNGCTDAETKPAFITTPVSLMDFSID